MVMRLPERDEYSYHRDKMHANMAVAMGGRVAEEIIFGYDKVSSGASGDIQYATDLARNMVTQWGMSDKVGPVMLTENQQEVFLGQQLSQQKNVSEATAQLIDAEVKRVIEKGYARAKDVLSGHEDQLHQLAGALLEYETLSGDEIEIIMGGGSIDRSDTAKKRPVGIAGGASAIPKAGKRAGRGGEEPDGGAVPEGA
jgi:cell division protease FtsH